MSSRPRIDPFCQVCGVFISLQGCAASEIGLRKALEEESLSLLPWMRNALVWNTKLSWKKSSRRVVPNLFSFVARDVDSSFDSPLSASDPDRAMVQGDENYDPDKLARVLRLRREEKRLREQGLFLSFII